MQIILTIPRLRMTLHLSHMGFTLVRTFMINPPRKRYNTPFSNFFLQVARPDLSFFHQTFVMMHFQLSFYLAHGVKIDAHKDQE